MQLECSSVSVMSDACFRLTASCHCVRSEVTAVNHLSRVVMTSPRCCSMWWTATTFSVLLAKVSAHPCLAQSLSRAPVQPFFHYLIHLLCWSVFLRLPIGTWLCLKQ